MKLEVGMYVRTKQGKIYKIINNDYLQSTIFRQTNEEIDEPYKVLKASHNIIDLIEVGDYVNGYYVSKIWKIGEITHYVDEKPIQIKERQITIQAPSYGGIIHLHMDRVSDNTIILHGKSSGFKHYDDTNCDIQTLEGIMHANYGDYIIKGVKGEIYPCKPDIFEETYEILESQEINRLC